MDANKNTEVKVSSASQDILTLYSTLPMVFEAQTIFDLIPCEKSPQGLRLQERRLEHSFKKDYDTPEEGPLSWTKQFNLSNWGFIIAKQDKQIIGAAAIAHDTPEIHMLEGRKDLAVLWDIRVSPQHKRKGVGQKLFQAIEEWAISKNCTTLKIETQNNNVAACKFYTQVGCQLKNIKRFAYPQYPNEAQLLWYKALK